jgi:hypothetical protein
MCDDSHLRYVPVAGNQIASIYSCALRVFSERDLVCSGYLISIHGLLFQTQLCDCDRLCGLVVRVSGYRSEMYCASCEIRAEFIYVM